MAKRQSIVLSEAASRIREPVTKFGGQPVWLAEPQWPLSRELGVPMSFIGQILIPEDLFPKAKGKMAYIFMTDDTDDFVNGTWEPNGGENAVVIQPTDGVMAPIVEVSEKATGPTTRRYVKTFFSRKLKPKDVELSAKLSTDDEPDFISDDEMQSHDDKHIEAYCEAIQGNKIGGAPNFIQSDEFPDDEIKWRLLLQLDSCAVPFHLNFGDSGMGYVFVDEGVTRARMLWQCC